MKRLRTKLIYPLLAMLLPLAMLSSCSKEEISNRTSGDDEAKVTFSLSVPGAGVPAARSRAMTYADENNITVVDVLAFKDGIYSFRATTSQVDDNGATNKKKFTVTLRKGPYDLVIVANATLILASANLSGKTKAQAMDLLTGNIPSSGKWGATGNIVPIPMWGNVGVKDVGTDVIPEITLLRMLARVNVNLNEVGSRFSLQSVHLYNYNSKGMLAPAKADWSTSPVTAPNLPAAPGRTVGPIEFAATTAGTACVNEVYMFEAAAGSKTTLSTNPCVVVGGTFDGQPAFYRVDFSTDPNTYLSIKRNHSYNIAITAVSGPGYPTPDDAFNAGPENITVAILEWDDGAMGDVAFDGQHYLSVAPSEFSLYMDATSGNKFTVKTDVKTGWTRGGGVTDSPASGGNTITWIKIIDGSFSGVDNKDPVTFDVDQNTTGAVRTGYIHIKAGRLDFAVKVTQNTMSDVGVWILNASGPGEIQELIFSSAVGVQPDAQKFRVRWAPASTLVTVSTTAVSGTAFAYSPGSDTPGIAPVTLISDASGQKLFNNIQPPAMTSAEILANPFLEKASRVDFMINANGRYMSKSIFLRQINYNLTTDVKSGYTLNSQTETLTVRANFGWKIENVSDSDDILQGESALIGRMGGNNITTGDAVQFKMAAYDVSKVDKSAVITFTNLAGGPAYNITITATNDLYVGYFAGDLIEITPGVWRFEKALYVQNADEGDPTTWGPNTKTNVTDGRDGKTNTWTLRAATYPAANRCFTKNANPGSITDPSYIWYLPARNQLMAIWTVHNSFDTTYKFSTDNYYWSASEYNADFSRSWSVDFGSAGVTTLGATTANIKISAASLVRCVREK